MHEVMGTWGKHVENVGNFCTTEKADRANLYSLSAAWNDNLMKPTWWGWDQPKPIFNKSTVEAPAENKEIIYGAFTAIFYFIWSALKITLYLDHYDSCAFIDHSFDLVIFFHFIPKI